MKGRKILAETLNLEFENNSLAPLLFGPQNTHLHHLEKKLGIHIASRGHKLTLSGSKAALSKAQTVLECLWQQLEEARDIGIADIDAKLRFIEKDETDRKKEPESSKPSEEFKPIQTKKKSISPRSPRQAQYLSAIQKHDMVFGLGPAGTGKTYLAVAAAVAMYLEGKVERLIFCRPALEAGERLGFLPGDMKEKVDPYLRPVYDALHDMLPVDFVSKKMEADEIEIAPLAFMRGRTLSNAFVVLDEAQNATCAQMKMFLTRMGESSRMVITGDPTQTDLPASIKSGLHEAVEILADTKEIGFVRFSKDDVVRHDLVGKIIHAYASKNL